MLSSISSNQLLAPKGRIFTISRKDSIIDTYGFAHRIWDELEFNDGESLVLTCFWRPYEGAENIISESTGSTNDDLLSKSGIGTHIASKFQTNGRGRRDRTWTSIEKSYAGSWIVAEGESINPGHLQLSGALAVLNMINDERLTLKWPNDILIGKKKLCGILAEGISSQDETKVVLGIGLNLKMGSNDNQSEYSALDEIVVTTFDGIDSALNRELSSLLEESPDLPPIRNSEVRDLVLGKMRSHGTPVYNGQSYESFNLNERGELLLGSHTVDDGGDVDWI
jgi:hypothetical protein